MDQTPNNIQPANPAPRKRWRLFAWAILVICLLVIGLLYRYIVSGGLTARQKASAIESYTARKLVEFSIPSEARARKNPLEGGEANADAGRELYRAKCEVCHGYDGRDRT